MCIEIIGCPCLWRFQKSESKHSHCGSEGSRSVSVSRQRQVNQRRRPHDSTVHAAARSLRVSHLLSHLLLYVCIVGAIKTVVVVDRFPRGGFVTELALEMAYNQTNKYLQTLNHEDIDRAVSCTTEDLAVRCLRIILLHVWMMQNDKTTNDEWDQFITWYYHFVQ